MDIHKDLDSIMLVAEHCSKEHKCNYTVINHANTTYEYVTDSYFEKERPNCEIIHKFEYKEETLEEKESNSLIEGLYLEAAKRHTRDIALFEEMKYSHLSNEEINADILPVRNSKDDPKIGRNETCPCGSGKKYKHCCIK
jgi:preprotein translocase subunit SecA